MPREENPFSLLDKDKTIIYNLLIPARDDNINTDLLSIIVLNNVLACIGK